MAVATAIDPARSWLTEADLRALSRRAKAENFPVASRLLPASARPAIAASYALARLVDEAGDSAPPALRLPVLDLLAAELRLRERSQLPVIRALPPSVPSSPFFELVQANRRDQTVRSYATREDLLGYCALSAAPVGRIVLHVLGLATQERLAWSDSVCAGLQVAEHLQDVGEDLAAGRVYLPAASLAAHGVDVALLERAATACVDDRRRLEALYADEVAWARLLLDTPLVSSVPGRARLAVAGFVAGGRAALDAVLAAGADAVRTTPRPRRARFARHLLGALR